MSIRIHGDLMIDVLLYTTPLASHDTGVCEINTHLDGDGVFNVPTPLPVF